MTQSCHWQIGSFDPAIFTAPTRRKLAAGVGGGRYFYLFLFFLTASLDFYRRTSRWPRVRRVFLWPVGELQIEWAIIISLDLMQNMHADGQVPSATRSRGRYNPR